MKLKKLLAAALVGVMTLSLAACGGGSKDSGSAEGGSKAGELKVCIWDSNQQAGVQQIADKWSETSGVKVKVEVVDWDNYWKLLEAGAQGGEMPDVFWMHSNTVQMYMQAGKLLDLTDYIANDEAIDMANYYDGIVTLYQNEGKQYAVPKDHDTIALLYNKAIFEKYGVDVPTNEWTWEDVYTAAEKITTASNGDVYGYAMNTSNNQDGWYNLVWDYGAQVVTDDHKDTTLDSAEAKAGMEMMRKILTVSAPQSVVAETGTDSLFQSDKVGMITQGSWMINSFYTAEHHADYAWAMLPYADVNGDGACQPEERWSCYNGLGWAANADVADPDSAYSLISYFGSEEGQLMQSELGVTMAAYIGASDAFTTAFEGMDVSAFTQIEEEGSLYMRPYTRKTTVWEDALQQTGAFLDAWTAPDDSKVMETACDNAAKIIRDAIAAE